MLAHHKNPDLRARQHEPHGVSLEQNGEPGDEAFVPWHAGSPVVEGILKPTAQSLDPDGSGHWQSLPTNPRRGRWIRLRHSDLFSAIVTTCLTVGAWLSGRDHAAELGRSSSGSHILRSAPQF